MATVYDGGAGSFCSQHASIEDCRKYVDFGRRITTDFECTSLITALLDGHKFSSKYSKFTAWPHASCTTLHIGKPSGAKHIAVTGILT